MQFGVVTLGGLLPGPTTDAGPGERAAAQIRGAEAR